MRSAAWIAGNAGKNMGNEGGREGRTDAVEQGGDGDGGGGGGEC